MIVIGTLLAVASLALTTVAVSRGAAHSGERLRIGGILYATISAAALLAAVAGCWIRGESGLAAVPALIAGGVSAYSDLETGYVFDYALLTGAALTIAIGLPFAMSWNELLGAAAGAALPLALYVLTRGNALGFGDVKLAALLGTATGVAGSPIMLATSCISGAIVGVFVLLFRRSRTHTMPFAPFLAVGACVAVLGAPG